MLRSNRCEPFAIVHTMFVFFVHKFLLIQDLSITIISQLNANNVTLQCDHTEEPINAKGFINSSEWDLHETLTYHVHNPRSVSVMTSSEAPEVSANHAPSSNDRGSHVSDGDSKLSSTLEEVKEADLFPVFEDARIVGSLRRRGGSSFLEISRPHLTVSCKATRRASFFVFNVILIIVRG